MGLFIKTYIVAHTAVIMRLRIITMYFSKYILGVFAAFTITITSMHAKNR